jgi:hypothetical protein
MKHIAVTLPLKIESVANKRWHWAKLATYHKTRRLQAWAELRALDIGRLIGPVRVVITRIAPRQLDGHDNLRSGAKGLVDGVADWLGVPDSDPRIQWDYAQETGAPKQYAVRIEVFA